MHSYEIVSVMQGILQHYYLSCEDIYPTPYSQKAIQKVGTARMVTEHNPPLTRR